MTLDRRLTESAHQVVERLTPPTMDVGAIRARARRNRRRSALLTAAATLVAVGAVGAGVVAVRDTAAPGPVEPAPGPVETLTTTAPEQPNAFPTSMSSEEVVNDPRSDLWTAAVAPSDPATRISMWLIQCDRPCPDQGPFEFTGAALTTDGYATTTYFRPPFSLGVDLTVSSPRSGLFLVVDQSNGGEWLIDEDGIVRTVAWVDSELRPTDPRLWFQCPSRWRHTWCALDPDTATAYMWPRAWDGSAVRPGMGDRPWGANPEPRATGSSGRLEAWWDTTRGRQLKTLAMVHEGDYILDTPPGEMAYWSQPDGTGTVDLHTSRDGGGSWEVDTREAPDFPEGMQVRRSPDGAYLATSTYPQLIVWRAEATGGPFRMVYEQAPTSGANTSGAGLWTQDDLVYATANATVAVSHDDGLTWRTIETWR